MQDRALCHTAKSVKEFLLKKKMPLLDWRGNSLDVNPIESVWRVLKMKLARENITTKAQFNEFGIRDQIVVNQSRKPLSMPSTVCLVESNTVS